MSARRELLALWTRCDTLRSRLGTPGADLDAAARRALEDGSVELAGAARRLGSAGMLTPSHARDLEEAREGLSAAAAGRMDPFTAVARYAFALQEVAAGLRVPLGAPGNGEENGLAPDVPLSSTATVVEALAYAGSLATGAGHRLGGFSGSGGGAGRRFTARCAGCGGLVSVQRQAGAWSLSRVAPCAAGATAPVPS
jgi:hypothetical protein